VLLVKGFYFNCCFSLLVASKDSFGHSVAPFSLAIDLVSMQHHRPPSASENSALKSAWSHRHLSGCNSHEFAFVLAGSSMNLVGPDWCSDIIIWSRLKLRGVAKIESRFRHASVLSKMLSEPKRKRVCRIRKELIIGQCTLCCWWQVCWLWNEGREAGCSQANYAIIAYCSIAESNDSDHCSGSLFFVCIGWSWLVLRFRSPVSVLFNLGSIFRSTKPSQVGRAGQWRGSVTAAT